MKCNTLHSLPRALTGVFMAISCMFQVAAAAEESKPNKARLPNFEPKGVILDYEGLRYRPHDDLIFPSVVATSGRFPKPLGRYYLYYAPHDPPGGICMAYADRLEGPWTEYAHNPLIPREWKPHYKVSHVSGPHALWNAAEKKMFLYFHGENPETRLATSPDGIRFDYEGTVLTTAMFPGLSEASYARVFEHRIARTDTRFVMLFMGNDKGTRRIYQARSADGRKWRPVDGVFMDPPPGTDQVAGAWWIPWNGRNYIISHANADDANPRVPINNKGFNLYLNEADAGFTKTRPLGRFMDASVFGADNAGLMSPCVFEENGVLYLFVNTGPRLKNKISLAIGRP